MHGEPVLCHSLAEDYDAVCVEDLNLKGIAGGLHFGKGIQDNVYGHEEDFENVDKSNFVVAIDTANGATSVIAEKVFL